MLFCCHRYFGETEKRYLDDTISKTHQYLEFGTCPICNTKRLWYEYKYYGKKRSPIRKKGKKAEQLLKDLLTQPFFEISKNQKQGSKSNMQWVYQYNGQAKDFNNVIKFNCKTDLKIVNITQDTAPSQAGAFSS